jgi:hypothetical protein
MEQCPPGREGRGILVEDQDIIKPKLPRYVDMLLIA